MNQRYAGKPFLRLLECYVLQTVGGLSEENAATLEAMTPKLAQTYGERGRWHEIVGRQAGVTAAFDQQIHTEWQRHQQAASQLGQPPAPEAFAQEFVDRHFPETVRPPS